MSAAIAQQRSVAAKADAEALQDLKKRGMPVTVIGGIIGGAFTATEGSAIAVVYALLIGFFVTKKLKLSDLPEALMRAAITTAIVCAMIPLPQPSHFSSRSTGCRSSLPT